MAYNGYGYFPAIRSNCTWKAESNAPGDGATGGVLVTPSAAGECTLTSDAHDLVASHKYYLSFKVRFETALSASFDWYWPVAEPPATRLSGDFSPSTWTRLSAVFTRTGFTDGSYPCRWDYNNESENVAVQLTSVMLFDLTEAFGAGNEPNKEWLDANITTFGDTLTVQYSGNIVWTPPDKWQEKTGAHVSFKSPLDSTFDGKLQIGSNEYTIVDACENTANGKSGAFVTDAIIDLILDCENKKAYLQNSAASSGTGSVDLSEYAQKSDIPTTADEVGALPITGGTITGALTVAKSIEVQSSNVVIDKGYVTLRGGSFGAAIGATAKNSLSLAGYNEDGGLTMTDTQVALKNLATPSEGNDAANKAYVDSQVASAVTSGVLKYSRTDGFVNQSLSIDWWEFGSDVSYTTFTGIFGNQTPYDITIEDPEEGVETKLIMDCWGVDEIYGHFFVNDEIRFFKMTKDGGIDEVAGESYRLISDSYSKSETDTLLASAGKVKTVNGVEPDSSGNIEIEGGTGKDGTTFTPSVSADGTLSWTNDGGKDNPASVNIKGAKGDTGAQGAKGDTGATPNIQIGDVTTLAAGSSATAMITGTADNPLLNLGIPKGKDGSGGSGSGDSSDTITVTDTDNSTVYTLTLKLVGGKPVIEYE